MNEISKKMSKEQLNFINSQKSHSKFIKFFQIFILVLFIFIWEISANLNIIDPFIFSKPSRIMLTAIEMIKNGTLWYHIGITLFETIIGFTAGTILGTAAAIVLWWNKTIYE